MQATSGKLDCQGAVFVYKDDKTTNEAWEVARGIAHIRCEVHDSHDPFLEGIRAWSSAAGRDPDNAFLAIYAHMGTEGLAPKRDRSELVTWADLRRALDPGVETLWLVGCTSSHVTSAWPSADGPVRGYLLATEDAKLWLPLLRLFSAEISLDQVRPYSSMPGHIAGELTRDGRESHAASIQYYEAGWETWRRFP